MYYFEKSQSDLKRKDEDMKELEKLFNNISMITGIFGGAIAYIFGGWDILMKTIVFLAIADYITGWIKAIYLKQLSSEIAFKGILRKIMMFIVIAVGYRIQLLVGNAIPLREVIITFYICNEALSLLENAAVFVPIPDKLKEVLLQLREKNDSDQDA